MTEWMRLGTAAGTLVVALLCALAAGMTDQSRLRSSRRGEYAFVTAAVLLIVCIPLIALDAAGLAGPLDLVALVSVLAGALILTRAGCHFVATTESGMSASIPVGFTPEMDRSFVKELALVGRTGRAAPECVPVVLVSVAGDRHLVELSLN